VHRKGQGGEGLGKAVAAKVAEVQNMARHVLRNAGAVALRAALEPAMQLGEGDEVNRQAEMAQVVLHAAGEGSIWDGEGSGHPNRPRK
jgi:hypothetical protein